MTCNVSEFSQRRGLRAGAFDQACDFCPATHADYGRVWPVCRECGETCCELHTQPGTEREDERGDEGHPRRTCVCVRCADEQQQEAVARG